MKPSELNQLLLVVADAAHEAGHDWLGEFMQKLAAEGVPKSLADFAHAMEKAEYRKSVEDVATLAEELFARMLDEYRLYESYSHPHALEEDYTSDDDLRNQAIEQAIQEFLRPGDLEQRVHILAYASPPRQGELEWQMDVDLAAREAFFSDVARELARKLRRR